MDTILLFIGKLYILQKENTVVLKTKEKPSDVMWCNTVSLNSHRNSLLRDLLTAAPGDWEKTTLKASLLILFIPQDNPAATRMAIPHNFPAKIDTATLLIRTLLFNFTEVLDFIIWVTVLLRKFSTQSTWMYCIVPIKCISQQVL